MIMKPKTFNAYDPQVGTNNCVFYFCKENGDIDKINNLTANVLDHLVSLHKNAGYIEEEVEFDSFFDIV